MKERALKKVGKSVLSTKRQRAGIIYRIALLNSYEKVINNRWIIWIYILTLTYNTALFIYNYSIPNGKNEGLLIKFINKYLRSMRYMCYYFFTKKVFFYV